MWRYGVKVLNTNTYSSFYCGFLLYICILLALLIVKNEHVVFNAPANEINTGVFDFLQYCMGFRWKLPKVENCQRDCAKLNSAHLVRWVSLEITQFYQQKTEIKKEFMFGDSNALAKISLMFCLHMGAHDSCLHSCSVMCVCLCPCVCACWEKPACPPPYPHNSGLICLAHASYINLVMCSCLCVFREASGH